MSRTFGLVGATVLVLILLPTASAQPPHHGGLPPGLQKKLERGEPLPPGWSDRAGVYEYGYDQAPYDQYGYGQSYYDPYEAEYVEDKVYRVIRDLRDIGDLLSR
ncbi:hypothetical protein ABC977_06275 [Thioalkalicoccus limnaeus]|uniref:Uncharacterized protein n=1 Tax=Thioalkalicoccus limnaeus TaxID=120681 RepID=A0ABV4BC76_9GAMM